MDSGHADVAQGCRNAPVLLVASAGGRLAQLVALREWWESSPACGWAAALPRSSVSSKRATSVAHSRPHATCSPTCSAILSSRSRCSDVLVHGWWRRPRRLSHSVPRAGARVRHTDGVSRGLRPG